MSKLALRTKVETVILMLLLISIATATVMSVTRTISDSHDDIKTFIVNSNGNYWEAIGENIQVAVDDIGDLEVPYGGWGGVGATVWLPGGKIFNISSTITLNRHITLDMGGSVIRPTGNFDVIDMKAGSGIKNGCINVSAVGDFDHGCIVPYASDYIDMRQHILIVQNMDLISSNQRGAGIKLYAPSGIAQGQAIVFCRFSNIYTQNFEYGILIKNEVIPTGRGAFLNGNIFTDLTGYGDKYYIWIERNTEDTEPHCANGGNYFENIQFWCTTNTQRIIRNDGYGNIFTNVMVYDWDDASGDTSYEFTSDSRQCYLAFRGGSDDLVNNGHRSNTILDLETGELDIYSIS